MMGEHGLQQYSAGELEKGLEAFAEQGFYTFREMVRDFKDELEEAKPRIGSRLMDVNVVLWQSITAPNYRDQRRTRRPNRSGGSPAG
jgi:hypothetical protein